MKISYTKSCFYLIYRFSGFNQGGLQMIKIWVLYAFPQMNIIHGKFMFQAKAAINGTLFLLTPSVFMADLCFMDHFFISIKNLDIHISILTVCVQKSLNYSFFVAFNRLCLDPDSSCSIMIQIKMALADHQQIYVPVNSSIECKVCFLRIDPCIWPVIHQNFKVVILVFQIICYVLSEC